MSKTKKYICIECGARMKEEDDVLICPKCGHWVEQDFYEDEKGVYKKFYEGLGNGKYDEDSFWTECDDFPEDFPGINYDEVYDED